MLAVVRFTEPYVYNCFRLELVKLGICKRKKSVKKIKKGYEASSLCDFTHSAMNIEFVYLILISINNFMEELPQDK